MTVVVIVGVLSAVAIPTFSDYVYKSRTTEATEFLGVIRLREEAYRSEFGAYCPTVASNQTSLGQIDAPDELTPDPSKTQRETTVFKPTDEWRQLGASPSGPIRFGYGVVAGDPSTIPANLGFETKRDFWWLARAVADLDADGTYVMFETYSASRGIFIADFKTLEPIAKGWE